MDSLNELIAAGEKIIKERTIIKDFPNLYMDHNKEDSSNLSTNSSDLSENYASQLHDVTSLNATQDSCSNSLLSKQTSKLRNMSTSTEQVHKFDLDSSGKASQALLCHESSKLKSASSNSQVVSSYNGEQSFKSESSYNDDGSSLRSNFYSNDDDLGISTESFSQLHIEKLKEECALIFSLSHSFMSSLMNANRLLLHLSPNGNSETDPVQDNSILSKISACNDSCKGNEDELQASCQRIHTLLRQISESYYKSKDQEEKLGHITKQTLDVLDLMKELLAKNNLSHLIPDLRSIRSPTRLMEEVNLGLTLLLGEMPSRILQEQTLQLKESANYQKKLERRIEAVDKEIGCLAEEKNKRIVHIEMELERKERDLEDLKEEIKNLQDQQGSRDKLHKDEVEQKEKKIIDLVQEVLNLQHLNMEMKTASKREREEFDHLRKNLEEEVTALKNKLRSIDELKSAQEKTSEKTFKDLEGNQHRITHEIEQLRSKLSKAEIEKNFAADHAKALEEDLENQKKLNGSLKVDIASLLEKSQKKSEEYTADLQSLEKRIDAKMDEICEKNSEIRQSEVTVMELKADLNIEMQRNYSLNSELDLLKKQVETLSDKIKKIITFCPRSVRIEHGLGLHRGSADADNESELTKYLEESQKREAEFKRLLNEKDEEMKNLRDYLGCQISEKNEELEKLSQCVENLEGEMSKVLSSLNMSSELYEASHKTTTYLDSRCKEIEDLQHRVQSISLKCNSCNLKDEKIEQLKAELDAAKKTTRLAREEARKERIDAAKMKQQLTLLQIDLNSSRELYKCQTGRRDSFQSQSLNSINPSVGENEEEI